MNNNVSFSAFLIKVFLNSLDIDNPLKFCFKAIIIRILTSYSEYIMLFFQLSYVKLRLLKTIPLNLLNLNKHNYIEEGL